MSTPEHPDKNLPTLSESLDSGDIPLTNIRIPVLEEVVSRDAIERLLSQRLALPQTLQKDLTERVTRLVQHRLSETLPDLMRIVQEEITENVCRHISDALPGIIEELIRNAAQQSSQQV